MALVNYDISGSSEEDENEDEESQEVTEKESKKKSEPSEFSLPYFVKRNSAIIQKINATPEITIKEAVTSLVPVDMASKELTYNPRYDELFTPEVGPENPFKSKAHKNMMTGFVEEAHINPFHFDLQRRTFHNLDYAADPSEGEHKSDVGIVGDLKQAVKTGGQTLVELGATSSINKKRKREKNDDPSDIEGYRGPWAKFQGEESIAKPSEEDKEYLKSYLAKVELKSKKRRKGPVETPSGIEPSGDEKSTLHIESAEDYQGRSFLSAPHDIPGVNLFSDSPPQKCFVPKRLVHEWTHAHTRGVSCIRLFPLSGHLLLSAGMDSRIKLWEMYKNGRLLRSYLGHKEAVRDICFDNAGAHFLSASYDRSVKLWDTETGNCVARFGHGKRVYCVRFNPDDDKQHFFLAGTADKKILCFDTRSGEVTQEYDRHLGAVNTITFVDNNRRFVTTSDDNSLRVWEWDIAVDFKHLADPNMQSMPAATLSPNGKWLVCQSMDSKIIVFNVLRDFKRMTKKTFSGHMSAGYACNVDFSPEMSYLVSGDGDGRCFVWNFKTRQIATRWKAHDGPCLNANWLPHETSKLVTAGWDGNIKLWD